MKREKGYVEDIRSIVDPSSWMVPYCNLLTILMIFFLLLYGFSTIGGIRYERVLIDLQRTALAKAEQKESKIEDKLQETRVAAELVDELKRIATVEINAQYIKIFLPSPVLFPSGSAELTPEAVNILKEIASSLRTIKNKVIVEGHTDNIPISKGGKYSSNFELSAARAFSVVKYFIDKEKIPPERFSVYGYGEYKPIAPNDTEENRAKNRRIEISIVREK
jgi:chemotaxis protein MotB